jgi:predicted aspartyl protease
VGTLKPVNVLKTVVLPDPANPTSPTLMEHLLPPAQSNDYTNSAGGRRILETARDKLMIVEGAFGGSVSEEMGTFRTTIEIENPARRGERRALENVLVDTGAELSWVPAPILESLDIQREKRLRFRQASGTVLERWTGIAIVHAGGTRTADDVVFGEPEDMVLLGARSLEGLNLRVDPVLRQLIDAGPAPAATAGAAV